MVGVIESPVAYLTKDPTPDEATLAEQCGLHTGAAAPFWMLVRVAIRTHATAAWISARRSFERRMRKLAWAAALALAGNIGVWVTSALGHAKDAGVEQERVAALGHHVEELGRQIEEIRQVMLRKSGIDPLAPSGAFDIDGNVIRDKMSLITRTPDFCSIAE